METALMSESILNGSHWNYFLQKKKNQVFGRLSETFIWKDMLPLNFDIAIFQRCEHHK